MGDKQIKLFEENTNILVQFPVVQVEDLDEAAKRLNWSRNKLIRFCCEFALRETNLKPDTENGEEK